MKYISTRNSSTQVSFRDAVINGLAADGGLYMPESIERLPDTFFRALPKMENGDIAFNVLKPFVASSLSDEELMEIVTEAFNFPSPVVPVKDQVYALELFHGPTKAFKDFGARFMSRCLSTFRKQAEQQVTILVATSGDTGSAVASGFYNVPGVAVKVLFPKDKVSPYQEHQMTSLGKNITAIEVNGTFDDCQHLVKTAFADPELTGALALSTANSINIARLLPQMLYYFFAYKQLPAAEREKIVFSVPSGNLGNLTAGLLAKRTGLPVNRFIAAHNDNDTFHQYMQNGRFEKKPSVLTYSNAMDVGNPSNFERIAYLYQSDPKLVREDVSSFTYSNEETVREMENLYRNNNYLADPHGAIGSASLADSLQPGETGIFLETAHPVKFDRIVKMVLPGFKAPNVDLTSSKKISMENNYQALKNMLLSH